MSAFDRERFDGALTTRWLGRACTVLGETESTMDVAREAADEGSAHGHVVLALSQRAGRGSRGRTWHGDPGMSLMLSAVVRPGKPIGEVGPLTLAVGLGVADAVESLLPDLDARVKWPNDVWVGERKLAGILLETRPTGGAADAIIVGLGLNVGQRAFPDALGETATSLALLAGDAPALEDVAAATLGGIERWVERLFEEGASPIVDALAQRMLWAGRDVCIDGAPVGRLVGIAADGALLVRDGGEVARVIAGTLTVA